jgi:hypothetical protein
MKKTIFLSAIFAAGLLSANAQIVTVDNADAKKDWSAGGCVVSLDTKDVKEGKAALLSEGEGPYRFRKVFNNPVDIGTDGTTGYLSFWYYIDNIEEVNLNRGFMIISSSGKAEEEALRLPFKNLSLNKGWNYVQLNLADAQRSGSFTGKINYFALFQRGTATSSTFKMDNIRFSKNYDDLKL